MRNGTKETSVVKAYNVNVRIMCFADTHGVPPKMTLGSWDAIFHAGDFYNRLRKTAANQPSDSLRAWISAQKATIYAVHGNHDIRDQDNLWTKAHDPSGTCIEMDEAWLFGVGWNGEHFFETPTEEDLQKVCEWCIRASKMKVTKPKPFILLTHYPPSIPHSGNAAGFMYKCIGDLVDYLKPKLVIAGHLHQNGPKFRMDGDRMTLFPSHEGIGVQLLGDAIQLV